LSDIADGDVPFEASLLSLKLQKCWS